MQISAFLPIFQNQQTRYNSTPNYKYSNLAPLKQDTVSFGATEKKNKNRNNGINRIAAKQIHEEAVPSAKYMERKINNILGDLVRPETGTGSLSKPIKVINPRLKSVDSIIEKSATRSWYTQKEVKEKMTDIVGCRIVMADASIENVDKVLDRITKAVEKKQIQITEIENYRPDPELDEYGNIVKTYDYASPRAFKNLKDACAKQGRIIKKKDEDRETGYMAIHMLMKLPNGFVGEIQIMGADVEDFKEKVEDKCFKVKNNKGLEKKYASVEKMLSPLKDDDDEILQNAYTEYTRRAYVHQRNLEPIKTKKPAKKEFLHIPEDLDYIPPQLDFNEIAKEVDLCNQRESNRKPKKDETE